MKTIWVVLLAMVAAVGVVLSLYHYSQNHQSYTESHLIIHYTQAREYAGRNVIVWGTIRNVFNNRLAVYLGFEEPRRGSFFVRILREDWPNFPDAPEKLYRPGQTIRVRGKIVWYQGDPIIYVRHPSQIEITKEARP
ncbi:MAG: hypothetical protein ACK4HB_07055 [Candidatus Bipolaricaulia bacterium]